MLRHHRLARLVDEEFHAIELEEEVVREFDIGLVDLVDEQHRRVGGGEGFPELAALDVVADVVDAGIAELAVAEPRHGIILVKPLLRLGGGLDVPGYEVLSERLGDLMREYGLAGAGLALDEEGALERDGGVDGDAEIVGGDVSLGALEALHDVPSSRPAPSIAQKPRKPENIRGSVAIPPRSHSRNDGACGKRTRSLPGASR